MIKKILLSVAATMIMVSAGAVPAKRGLFTVIQPDGTELKVQRVGDERLHFLLTEDSQLLINENGTYYYSHVDGDGKLVSTGVIARNVGERSAVETAVMQSIDNVPVEAIYEKRVKAWGDGRSDEPASRALRQSGLGRFSSSFPRTGKVKGLVILVQYSDVKFTLSDPYSYFYAMLNEQGFSQHGGTGSARDYFLSNSNNKFQPEFDVYGPYTLSKKMSYYGGNDSGGNDKNPEEMVAEACRGLNSQINFADYDCDNDGYVDNVFVFYAGRGEASGGSEDTVWPHQYNLSYSNKSVTLDGKTVDKYACSNEWEGSRPDGVGTFIHEFSHVMGLPDLYATKYSSSVTPGSWSVLDYGPYNNNGCTPPNYSIFERNAMGWCVPRELTGPETVTLENIVTSNDACIVNTNKYTEFFLIENRRQTGWDTYLPGHGMLIWHVDYVASVWNSNAVNNDPTHMYVELEKADGTSNAKRTGGWSFPGTSGNTSFTFTTRPSMKTWTNEDIEMPITNIEETPKGLITFDIAGGSGQLLPPVADGDPVATDNGFVVSWLPVEGATDYLVTVTRVEGDEPVSQNYDSVTLPDGWTKSSGIDKYTTSSNYVTNGASLKFTASGQALTTCDYDADVNEISFWMKGQSTVVTDAGPNSTLTVSGKINGAWTDIAVLTPENNKAVRETITNIPKGVKAVKFTYTKVRGNLALDDITIKAGGGSKEVLYDNVSTAGKTFITIDYSAVSRADAPVYVVRVKAINDKRESKELTITVDPAEVSGVENVLVNDADETIQYYNLQGLKVLNPSRGRVYIKRQGSKISKVIM